MTNLKPETLVGVVYYDTHFHGRRGPVMEAVLPMKAARTCGGNLEPNTKPHLIDYDGVCRYLDEAHRIAPDRVWRASIYLTADPNVRDIERLWRESKISHIKDYPVGGSTHTAEGVHPEVTLDKNSGPGRLMCLAQELGIPVKRHAEIAFKKGVQVDAYKREALDLREVEPRFMDTYPDLRRVLAHISTMEAVEHMRRYGDPDRYVCEVTAHHAAHDRTILFDGAAILSDHHCLPVIKKKRHTEAIQKLIAEKLPFVMAGSDSAAHLTRNKYRFDAFGGLFTYLCDLELYLEVLEKLGALAFADEFLYGNAKRFYGSLVPDRKDITPVNLIREPWTQDERVEVLAENDSFTPFGFHPETEKRKPFQWQLAS